MVAAAGIVQQRLFPESYEKKLLFPPVLVLIGFEGQW